MQTYIRFRLVLRKDFVIQGLTKTLLIENFSGKKCLYDPYESWSGIMLPTLIYKKALYKAYTRLIRTKPYWPFDLI